MAVSERPWNNLNNSEFRYTSNIAAPSIRLLTILPESTPSRLHCQLITVSLDSNPVYLALSYCWGDPSKTAPIICNNQNLSIAASQYEALQQFRSRDTATPIWIDAICINQYDKDEKTSQIQLLPSIYGSASSVIVWLGQKSAVENTAEETLNSLRRQKIAIWDRNGSAYMARRLANPAPVVLRALDAMEKRQESQWKNGLGEEWTTLARDYAIFQQAWFRRVWVLQEIVLATRAEFWAGDMTFSISDVFQKAKAISEKEQMDKTPQNTILSSHISKPLHFMNALYMSDLRQSIGSLSMRALLRRTLSYEASEPQDKIFALIAMSSDLDLSFVDYNLSNDEIVLRLGRTMLQADLPMSLSYLGIVVPKSEQRCPSWVADWLTEPIIDDIGEIYRTQSEDAICYVSFDSKNRLKVKARLLDTVRTVIQAPSEEYGDSYDFTHNKLVTKALVDFEWRCAELIDVNRHKNRRYVAGGSLWHAYWRTFVLNSASPTKYETPDPKMVASVWMWRLHMWFLRHRTTVKSILEGHLNHIKNYDYSQMYGVDYLGTLTTCYFGHFLGSCIESPSMWKLMLAPMALLCIDRFASIVGAILLFIGTMSKTWFIFAFFGTLDRFLRFACAVTDRSCEIFLQSLARTRRLKDFCVTERDFIGWCPKTAQAGDVLCVLTGSQFPFALRPCDGGYRLLGGCYVHGWMYGQVETLIAVEETDIVIV